MKLSLSVRIAEAACKTKLNIPFSEIAQIAADLGYSALCMRASWWRECIVRKQNWNRFVPLLIRAGLVVSMVTADFNIPQNNDQSPDALKNIEPSLHVAEVLGSRMIRVCLKTEADIAHAQKAADLAAERGMQLVHQFHPACLFEELERSVAVLKQIDRPNVGLIYEPASLLMCGQEYGRSSTTTDSSLADECLCAKSGDN